MAGHGMTANTKYVNMVKRTVMERRLPLDNT